MIFKYHKMEVLQPSKTKKWSTDEDALLSEIVRYVVFNNNSYDFLC